jgi:sugar lactone lactonase YvrE
MSFNLKNAFWQNIQVMKKIKLLTLTIALCGSQTMAQTVSTLAGDGVARSVDGTGKAASFDGAAGIALDKSGNVYLSDYTSNLIRKITPSGVVTTYAGTGVPGLANGPATSAQFHNPWGLATDTADNLYVADASNNCIRKITPAGIVSTIAGTGVKGFMNGSAATAEFSFPCNVWVDSADGKIYVSDCDNNCIRVISPAGIVSTFAGTGIEGSADGTVAAATFGRPHSIVKDSKGNFFITEISNHRIRKVSTSGMVTTFAGSTEGYLEGVGTSAKFSAPHGIIIDAGDTLYVAEALNGNRIRKITPDGVVSTIAGTGIQGYNDGPAVSAQFNAPVDIDFDRNSKRIYVSEVGNYLRAIDGVIKTKPTYLTEDKKIKNIELYPNPTNGNVFINVGHLSNNATITLIDARGKAIKQYAPVAGQNFIEIDMMSEAAGNYFVQIIDNGRILAKSFIKQ